MSALRVGDRVRWSDAAIADGAAWRDKSARGVVTKVIRGAAAGGRVYKVRWRGRKVDDYVYPAGLAKVTV